MGEEVTERVGPERPSSILDPDDETGLLRYVTPKIRARILSIDPQMFLLTEGDLKHRIRPTPVDYALRVSFWREFERATWLGTERITATSIYLGVCAEPYFNQKFLQDDARVAWMVMPLQTYKKEMEAILHRATERLWELVEIPIVDKRGRMDPRSAKVLLDVVSQVENRVKGMAIQRTEAKNLSVSVVSRSKVNAKYETVGALEDRIKQIEAEVAEKAALVAPGQTIDVEVQRSVVHVEAGPVKGGA